MDRLHLEVYDARVNGKSRRITRLISDRSPKPIEIFHEFDRIIPFSDDTPLDGHVLAVFLYAAALGKSLVVHGAISRTAQRNMEELSLLWHRWRPHVYKKIDVLADRHVDVPRKAGEDKAIAAFSGGVDATFTALRHAVAAHPHPRAARHNLRGVLMVHGFDVEIDNDEDFQKIRRRVMPLLDELKLEFRTVRTNSRELRLQNWEDTASLQLAACLHMHAQDFQIGLIGSSSSYEDLVLPCGSSPVTDHLMTGDRFALVHDGAGFSRTEKVAEILRNPTACKTLKVCWAGADQSENCGRCEKCVRTHLNFSAAGAKSTPPCFPVALDVKDIPTIQINNKYQLAELASILHYAEQQGVNAPWMPVLKHRLETWEPVDPAILDRQINGSAMKQSVVKALEMLGLDEATRRMWRKSRRAVLKEIQRRELGERDMSLMPKIDGSTAARALTPGTSL
jgi:hypothetical protein